MCKRYKVGKIKQKKIREKQKYLLTISLLRKLVRKHSNSSSLYQCNSSTQSFQSSSLRRQSLILSQVTSPLFLTQQTLVTILNIKSLKSTILTDIIASFNTESTKKIIEMRMTPRSQRSMLSMLKSILVTSTSTILILYGIYIYILLLQPSVLRVLQSKRRDNIRRHFCFSHIFFYFILFYFILFHLSYTFYISLPFTYFCHISILLSYVHCCFHTSIYYAITFL